MNEPQPALPPGPYRVERPAEQGGAFTLWGRQGTPPDFKDGWAIPLVASGVDTAMYAIRDILNAGTLDEAWAAAEEALPEGWGVGIQPVVGGYSVGASAGTDWTVEATAYGDDALPLALRELASRLRAVPA